MEYRSKKGWLYLLPAVLFLGVFMVYPLIDVFIYSMEEGFNFASQTYSEVGLYNFSYVLHDPYFLQALKNTFILVIITVPLSTGLALLISLALSSIRKLKDLFQTLFFLPYVTNTLAVGLVFMILFKKTPYSDGLVNLVLSQPVNLLGDRVHARFGKEFPIRFDMLDTMNGQNLSLQVHPLTEYIQRKFHMHYTQDESYYILDAQGEAPCVYLGIKTGTKPGDMLRDLDLAQQGGAPFPAERYVNQIPVKKHDHLLIPGGTVHCSGANTMVLEISATPYIFTFKLWDWGRLDLDGKPRPIHLEHGAANIQWDRNTQWVQENLVNAVTIVHQDARGTVERTGLHNREFLDTFRFTTRSGLPVHRNGSVHMLNLVEGRQALLVSPNNAFAPFPLYYAETCILPEAAGEYEILSPDGEEIKVILACVRG